MPFHPIGIRFVSLLFLVIMCSLHGAMRTGESCVNLINAPFRAAFKDKHDDAQEKIARTYNKGMKTIPHPGSAGTSGVRAIIYASQESTEYSSP